MSQPYPPPQPGRPGGWQHQPGAYAPAPPKTSTRGASILTLLGVLVLVVAVVVAAVGFTTLRDAVTDPLRPSSGSIVIARGPSDAPLTLEAEAGRTYSLVALDPTSAATVAATADVSGPGGDPVRVVPVDEKTHLSVDGFTVSRFASFTTTEAGSYTIDVVSSVSRSWDVAVADPGAVDDLARDLVVGVVLVVVGIIGAGLGLVLSISGWIWWAVRRSNRRKVAAVQAGAYGYPPQRY